MKPTLPVPSAIHSTTEDKFPTSTQWFSFDFALAILEVDPVLLNADSSAVMILSPLNVSIWMLEFWH